ACAKARTTARTTARMRKTAAGRRSTTRIFPSETLPPGRPRPPRKSTRPSERPVPARRAAEEEEIAHEEACYNGRHEPRRAEADVARRIPRMGGTAGSALRIRWRRTLRDGRRKPPPCRHPAQPRDRGRKPPARQTL